MNRWQVEDAWARFGDVPIGDDECILLPFSMEFGRKYIEGTSREEIWHDFDDLYAEWGGVHALMFPDEHTEARDGLDPREYVVGTFEPCDVEERVEPAVLDYIRDNGLMDVIVLTAVKHLRDAYDWDFGDTVCECLRSALIDEIGREKLEELEA